MRIRLPRLTGLGLAPLTLCAALAAGQTTAQAADCPGHPDAIGTSRTLVVDPLDHRKIGTMSYSETLPLADHEVVLTFDDGPLPPYTNRVLEILDAQCVKATYFIVGVMAKSSPELVRKVAEHGHTIGTHTMNHPIKFRRLSAEAGIAQLDNGIAATAAALGDAGKLAPFFRFPGFGWTEPVQAYAATQGLMIWGADMPADDWRRISAKEVAKRAISRIEANGKGVLLLHDIHERTVEALPIILKELKERGYRIVHVVPSSAERPATPTVASDWKLHPQRQATQQVAALPKNAMIDVSSTGSVGLRDRSEDDLGPAKTRRHGRHFVARERHHASRHHHRHVSRDRYPPRDRHAAR
jgi:peptidoglycan/xylan/chitin deacetylase (PgdA/CDA1 family)